MHKYLTTLLLSALTLSASAEVITPSQALQRAGLLTGGNHSGKAAPALDVRPALTLTAADALPALYVFDGPDGGMTVVSADDIATPLLGYTDAALTDGALPDNMRAWLEFYTEEIGAARRAGADASGAITLTRPYRKPVVPICKTTWNQDSPYNLLCPADKNSGKPTMTGCAATAMAQVLKTHRYPERCSGGSETYTPTNQNPITLNFDEITLDWSNMLDTYDSSIRATEAQRNAVATLMYALGVAGKMNYGTSASGATSTNVGQGLLKHFGIDESLEYVFRDSYELYEWENIIYSVLDGGHAAYYDGVTKTNSGHAFVVDGYRADGYFHLNWGWGGIADGYFLLSALDPAVQGIGGSDSGYNYSQGTYLNLKPAQADSEPTISFLTEHQLTLPTTVRKGASFNLGINNPAGAFYNFTLTSTDNASFVLRFTPANGGKARYSYSTMSLQGSKVLSAYGPIAFPYPSSIEAGEYYVEPMLMSSVTATFFPLRQPATNYPYTATVSSNSLTFHPAMSNAQVTVTDVATLTDANYPGVTSRVELTVTNASSETYYNALKAALLLTNPDGSYYMAYRCPPTAVNVAAGATATLMANYTIPADAAPGYYFLAILDAAGNVLSDAYPVKVQENPGWPLLGFNRLECTDSDINHLSFTYTATSVQGTYAGPADVRIFSADGATLLGTVPADADINVKEGANRAATFSGTLPAGISGQDCTAAVYFNYGTGTAPCSDTITFTLTGENTAIDHITADSAQAEYFDMLGRRITSPRHGTIYLRRQGDTTTKVIVR